MGDVASTVCTGSVYVYGHTICSANKCMEYSIKRTVDVLVDLQALHKGGMGSLPRVCQCHHPVIISGVWLRKASKK